MERGQNLMERGQNLMERGRMKRSDSEAENDI